MAEITLSLLEKQLDTPHQYRVFGLNILSDLPLNELKPYSFNTADVRIILGENPAELENPVDRGVLFQLRENEFLFRLDTVGSFYVRNGNFITIERLNNSTDQELSLFLLGSAFGALLHQRGLVPLHGSTIVLEEKAVPILGVSGAGKSSIAAEYLKRGYKILADDISVLEAEKNSISILPGVPQVKLWKDVMDELILDTRKYDKVRPQLLKYRKPAEKNYMETARQISKIIVLSTKNTPGFDIREIKGAEKFNILKNHTFRYKFMQNPEMIQTHFELINRLAATTPVYAISRPVSPILLEELADHILHLPG